MLYEFKVSFNETKGVRWSELQQGQRSLVGEGFNKAKGVWSERASTRPKEFGRREWRIEQMVMFGFGPKPYTY
jgi:hypothetical protein